MTAISQSAGPALLLDETWLDLSLVKRTKSGVVIRTVSPYSAMGFRSWLPPDSAPHLSPARRPYSRSALPGQNSPQRVYWCRWPQTQSGMPVQPEFRLLHSTDVVAVSGVRVSILEKSE